MDRPIRLPVSRGGLSRWESGVDKALLVGLATMAGTSRRVILMDVCTRLPPNLYCASWTSCSVIDHSGHSVLGGSSTLTASHRLISRHWLFWGRVDSAISKEHFSVCKNEKRLLQATLFAYRGPQDLNSVRECRLILSSYDVFARLIDSA